MLFPHIYSTVWTILMQREAIFFLLPKKGNMGNRVILMGNIHFINVLKKQMLLNSASFNLCLQICGSADGKSIQESDAYFL